MRTQIEKVYEPQRFEPHGPNGGSIPESSAPPQEPRTCILARDPAAERHRLLHMGHMLEHTEIDVTVRWHRMRGDNTLWLPGTDHAGIATQMVVERQLAEEGINRRELGREEFEERVWQWKAESGDTIKRQMIRLGASCDWTRERFTLDEGLSRAVREVFVRLYEKGLIYRGEYMVNWCPALPHRHLRSRSQTTRRRRAASGTSATRSMAARTAILTVATTRPETMLGDTAVAINPKDDALYSTCTARPSSCR